ncbi:hypothetical protein P7H89_13345 [Lactococcus lactis]|uniref:hypothetical protein n=1 Tax=Lactococcus lactis TaxID=1358 RepID=UPI00288D284F|nr:hypothetical protein [Lactococcus lactis]MDT2893424.1 hypothetical protein [Lactococcus lactis]
MISEQLKNAGAEEIFQEKFTGTTNSRPAFINLLVVFQRVLLRSLKIKRALSELRIS